MKMLNKDKPEPMEEEKKEHKANEPKRENAITTSDNIIYANEGTGKQTGKYHIVGVITHKGLSSDGGHYMSWVHHNGNEWVRIDDEIVGPVDTEEIWKLSGGRDCDMAYLLLYRRIEYIHPK